MNVSECVKIWLLPPPPPVGAVPSNEPPSAGAAANDRSSDAQDGALPPFKLTVDSEWHAVPVPRTQPVIGRRCTTAQQRATVVPLQMQGDKERAR